MYIYIYYHFVFFAFLFLFTIEVMNHMMNSRKSETKRENIGFMKLGRKICRLFSSSFLINKLSDYL